DMAVIAHKAVIPEGKTMHGVTEDVEDMGRVSIFAVHLGGGDMQLHITASHSNGATQDVEVSAELAKDSKGGWGLYKGVRNPLTVSFRGDEEDRAKLDMVKYGVNRDGGIFVTEQSRPLVPTDLERVADFTSAISGGFTGQPNDKNAESPIKIGSLQDYLPKQ
ncbi:hypothetical protein KDA14_01355, partial [Candidatus Saccharibacteria bacterium]|nr:hypothetical protein [Candidatus Saccharibacteria bacterium]